jgi:type III restriction enzyme
LAHHGRPNAGAEAGTQRTHLILETKGFDPLTDVKAAAARRWVDAVNTDGSYGRWRYEIARKVAEVDAILGRR